MEVIKSKHDFFLLLLLMIFGVVNKVHGNIADFDEVWKERAEKAHQEAMAAYDPNPELVSQNLTIEVESCVKEDKKHSHSKSGRHLRDKGQCQATNPIDRCWRCQADWEQNRKRLADCVLGFGRNTIGGKDGRIYVVTDASDDHLVNPPEGTLRHAVIQDGPLWIIFARSMIIRLSEELIVNSNKTIDGRGCNIQIMNGAGITIQYVQNVIIHGLHIHDIKAGGGAIIRDSPTHFGQRTRSDGDGISIFGSSRVWIDHISMSNCMDGLIDAIEMSTAITISNCHFTHHNEVMLLGASDSSTKDENMQITIAFNHFGRGLVQRMPRCRFGFFHVVNNDYTHWIMYAVGGSQHPTIYSQGNRYIAPHLPNAKEVTKRDYATEDEWKHWQWRSEGDLFVNGAFFVESGVDNKTKPRSSSDMISYKPGSYAGRLTRYSGALNCKTGVPC